MKVSDRPMRTDNINATSSSTIRARHFRERQRQGIRIVQFELLPEEIEAFVRTGLVTKGQADDRDKGRGSHFD